MMRILRNPWKEDFLRLVSESNKSIQITSPYIKEDICNDLIRVKKTFLISRSHPI